MSNPNIIRFEVPDNLTAEFEDFKKLAVLKNVKLADLFGSAVITELLSASDLDFSRWLAWNEFEAEMKKAKFSVARPTFWKYRNAGHFEGMVKTNGTNTLFDFPAILAYYQGGKVS